VDRSAWVVLLVLFALSRRKAAPVGPAVKKSLADLRVLAAAVGFPDPDTAAAVAMAESKGNPLAVGDDGTSLGLWQIHAPDHPEFDATRLMDANYNAHAALLISKSGTDWHLWTTFRPGPRGEPPAYLQYMPSGA
jgi:hypothetical protein